MTHWQTIWHAQDFDLSVEHRVADGRSMHRVIAAGGRPGAVVVALHEDRLLLVRQHRVAVGVTLWEFPRGFGDPRDEDGRGTGLRELSEETGVVATEARSLGGVWPDSGLLGNGVEVILVHVTEPMTTTGDGEVTSCEWVPLDRVDAWVRDGRIRDGITLSAWALVRAQDVRR